MSPPNPTAPRERTTTPDRLSPGDVVGEFVIEDLLAEGGMSSVYSAMHPLIAKRAAVKVMSSRFSHDEKAAEQFLLEARAVNQVGHPNIIDVFSCGRLEDGRSYLVMEWLEGETLGRRLWRERISFVESCEIILQICDALEAAHAQQIVHLDIKPDNVFLMKPRHGRPIVKLLDFGIARLLRGGPAAQGAEVNSVVGTPHYLSPEQAQASPELDHRSDVYSLGVLAYEMFSGRTPFQSEKVEDLLDQHVRTAPPSPDVEWTGVGPELSRLLLRLLYKAPDRRPSLAELREELRGLCDRATSASTQRFAPFTRRPGGARKWLVLSSPALLAILIFGWTFASRSHARVRTRSTPPPVFAAAPPVVSPPTAPAVLTPAPTPVATPKAKHRRTRTLASATRAPSADANGRAALGGGDYLIDYAGARRR